MILAGLDGPSGRSLPLDNRAALDRPQAVETMHAPAPSTPTPPPTSVGDATTPRDAVRALHAMALPEPVVIRGLPPEDRIALANDQARTFNTRRTEQAQAALDRLAPDAGAAPGHGAHNREDAQAARALQNDPYVRELHRIVDEAAANPTQIPAYLMRRDAPQTIATEALSVPQVAQALESLGVHMPDHPSPDDIAAGYHLLGALASDGLALVIEPGMQASYTHELSMGTTAHLSVRAEASAAVKGEVELSRLQTVVGFEQTQTFKATVEVEAAASVDLGSTPLNELHDRLQRTPDWVMDRVEKWPGASTVMDSADRAGGSRLGGRALKELPVSGDITASAGARLSFEATITPQQGTRLDAGDLSAVPNPLRPLDMPTGTSVMIRGQQFQGSAWELNYKMLTASGSTTDLQGMGFGVKRLDGSMVEVTSGHIDTMERSGFFGIDLKGKAEVGLATSSGLENSSMAVARIDLATQEGRAAYQSFLCSGRVPDWNPPGVQQSGRIEQFGTDAALKLGVHVGPAEMDLGSSGQQFSTTETRWQDGSRDYATQFALGSRNGETHTSIDAQGRTVPGSTQLTLVMPDFDPALVSYLQSAYAPDRAAATPKAPQHVQLTFTPEQLMDLRQQARDAIASGALGTSHYRTGTDYLAALDFGRETSTNRQINQQIAIAKDPHEVFAALLREPEAAAEKLPALAWRSNTALPGELRIQSAG